jgi:23S rRNA pseudouridine1911/1915/1917 synthase
VASSSTEPSDTLLVEPSEVGMRLDSFLVGRNLVPSAAAARRALAVVRVDGRIVKKGYRLAAGERVDFGGCPDQQAVLKPTPELTLSLLYADEALIAVDKPPGVPSHPLRAGEGATVAGAIVARYPECADASPDSREGGLGHRLDIGTSGVIVAARSRPIWHRLREALSGPACKKTYLAEVRGRFPGTDDASKDFVLPGDRPRSFVVSCPIGRQGRRGAKVKIASGRQPLPAQTLIALVETRPGGALVEAQLSHGRAHQVRAHLAYLGVPVVGDTTYGEAADQAADQASDPCCMTLHLHAWSISFLHPTTSKLLRIEAPLPSWAQRRL